MSVAARLRIAAPFLAGLVALALTSPCRADDKPPYPHGTFVEDCALCHGSEGWTPARPSPKFDHSRYFRLEGVHRTAPCSGCHASLKFAEEKTKKDCVACHQDVHDGELGAECMRCHTARSFIDHARMKRAHTLTRFPLVGAHSAADCDSCHPPQAQGHLRYVNLHSECVDCHLPDYLATTNPNHQATGFARNCNQCHFQNAWLPGRFPNHDPLFFPIFSGTHRGKWSTCTDCHYQVGVYTTFSCILCHAHDDPVQMAGNHSGVSGYSYNSAACYSCHPTGRKP